MSVAKHGYVWVRQSNIPEEALIFTVDEWTQFLAGAKAGEFDA